MGLDLGLPALEPHVLERPVIQREQHAPLAAHLHGELESENEPPDVAPAGGEAVIDKRHYSAFQATDLDTQLGRAGMGGLVICGVQTEVCVDTTCRAAAALGYDVTLVSDAHTTYD